MGPAATRYTQEQRSAMQCKTMPPDRAIRRPAKGAISAGRLLAAVGLVCSGLVLSGLVLAPSVATAGTRASLEPAARLATNFEYDARGRATARVERGFDETGQVKHVTRVALDYDEAGRLLSEEAVTHNARGALVSTALITYERDAIGQIVVEDRLWLDEAGNQLRRESDRWRTDQDGTRVGDTWEFDASDTQIGTRYTIVTLQPAANVRRGQLPRVLASDESRYDAAGVQVSRHLRKLTHNDHGIASRELFAFDRDDAVSSRVVEAWRYDGRGRLLSVEAQFFDGEGTRTQTSTDRRFYGTDGRLDRRTYGFSTPDGELLRQLDETYVYDRSGRLLRRDGAWRYLSR